MANCPRDYREQLRARLDSAKAIEGAAAGREFTATERAQLNELLLECKSIRARLEASLEGDVLNFLEKRAA